MKVGSLNIGSVELHSVQLESDEYLLEKRTSRDDDGVTVVQCAPVV